MIIVTHKSHDGKHYAQAFGHGDRELQVHLAEARFQQAIGKDYEDVRLYDLANVPFRQG